jgi:phage terminase large subunit-like protein
MSLSNDPLIEKKLELVRLRKLHQRRLLLAFDGLNPDAVPTEAQMSVLRDADTKVFWIVAANRSGKSQTGARVVAWWFNDNHPYMERPLEWGKGPLQILVVGRVGEQMTSELWERKLKPFLKPGDYKEVRIGNDLKRVINLKNNNTIIFLSHHDAANAREKVQAFTSHVVWLDEMPDDAGIVTELFVRTISGGGRLYATFTPLLKNEEIRRIIEMDSPGARKIQLKMLDNPVYRGREAEVEQQMRAMCSSEAEFRARMYGDWYAGDSRVFSYDHHRNRLPPPVDYDQAWRHVAVVDPSASGLTGFVLAAEDPSNGHWYVVKAIYLKGEAAYELVGHVEAETAGYNVVLRLTDCNPAGFYKEAARRNLRWVPYTEKQDRKLETIGLANTWLAQSRVFVTPAAFRLEEELVLCSWSEKNPDKIAGASKYHLTDCFRYLLDRIPRWDPETRLVMTPTQELRQAWRAKQDRQTKAAQMKLIQRRNQWKPRRSGSPW